MRKVQAAMSLLLRLKANRAIVTCFFSIVLLLILAPAPSTVQNRVNAFGPTAAWASSPDETLNPPPAPPKKSAGLTIVAPGTQGRAITGRMLFSIMWRMYWAAVRF